MHKAKIAFIDSGVGGLFFALDCLAEVEKKYNKTFDIVHLGDEKNVPYGIKTTNEIAILLHSLIEKTVNLGCKIIVVACNTACTVLTKQIIKDYEDRGIIILPIVNKSANAILELAQVVKNEMHIAILATKRTVDSDIYIHTINNLIKQNKYGALINIHQYSPVQLVENIENAMDGNQIAQIVEANLNAMQGKIGKHSFQKISAVGLFCTHYQYCHSEIYKYFSQHTSLRQNVQIISQGQTFASEILKYASEINQSTQSITSYTTGSDITRIKQSVQNLYPKIDINFATI